MSATISNRINIRRLEPAEVVELVRQGKLPPTHNPCLLQFKPLVETDNGIVCDGLIQQSYCSSCPMFPTRNSTTTQKQLPVVTLPKSMPTVDSPVEDPFEFESTVTGMRYKYTGLPRQLVITVPIKEARAFGLEFKDKVFVRLWKRKFPK